MDNDEFNNHIKKVYYGYKRVGFFERLICTFWYLTYNRWSWIFGKRRTKDDKS